MSKPSYYIFHRRCYCLKCNQHESYQLDYHFKPLDTRHGLKLPPNLKIIAAVDNEMIASSTLLNANHKEYVEYRISDLSRINTWIFGSISCIH